MDRDRDRELAAVEREAYRDARTDEFEPQRRRRGAGPLLVLLFAAVVLAASAAAGGGLAQLVARVASVPPPAVTVSPQPPATATALPSPSVSTAPVSPSPSGGEPTESAIPSQAIHVVQPGEFLSQIALEYGVTTEAIVAANDIENPDLIEAGQRLVIPPRP